MVKVTFFSSPGAKVIFWNAFNSFTGRRTLHFSSPTYSCTTSFPATLPVFFTGMVTVRELSAVIVLAEATGLP